MYSETIYKQHPPVHYHSWLECQRVLYQPERPRRSVCYEWLQLLLKLFPHCCSSQLLSPIVLCLFLPVNQCILFTHNIYFWIIWSKFQCYQSYRVQVFRTRSPLLLRTLELHTISYATISLGCKAVSKKSIN